MYLKKCGPETNDVCVNGFCLPAGCDNILYSDKRNDNCGICDGDNRSCDEVSQTSGAPTSYGYNRVLDIPSQATNINIIRKRSGDDLGCLALRTNRESVYILNGHYVISKSTLSTKFEGIRIDYIVDDLKEIIKSIGNFSQPLQVQFLAGSINSKSDNGVIKYMYYIQKEEAIVNNNNGKYELDGVDKDVSSHIPLKYIRNSLTKLRSQIGLESKGSPCNRVCHGVEKILASQDCVNSIRSLYDVDLCTSENMKYIERPCNTHCKLQ